MSKLVVISGPSGAGKGTVVKELINIYKEKGEKVYFSVSATTREARVGEVDGVNYYFIKDSPVISAGTSNPITVNIVGAISANLPSFKDFPSVWLDTHTNGTGSVV